MASLVKKMPLQCVLGPGELIYVPSGWWHAVKNLGDNVAYTQNFVDEQGGGVGTTMAVLRHLLKHKRRLPGCPEATVLLACLQKLGAAAVGRGGAGGGEL